MPISTYIKQSMTSPDAGVIRRMFEEGIRLKAAYGADKVFDFSLGNPDIEPPAAVLDAIAAAACERAGGVHGYMSNAGYPEARDAMALKTTREQGVPVDGGSVVMACGAAGALNCLFKAILNEGDEVVVPAPFFAEYRQYVRNAGGRLVEVPAAPDFSLDVDAMAAVLSDRTAAVLINSPHNPTGRVYPAEDLMSLARTLDAHAVRSGRRPYLVCDEPYRAITYGGVTVAAIFPLYAASIIVTSFAKNLSLPGERIGYLCVNPACPDHDEVVAACIFTTRILGFVNAPALFQRVVAHVWDAPADYSPYRKRRDELVSILDDVGIIHAVPEGAFYLWCKAPDAFAGDDLSFCDHLKRFLILAAPGRGFGGAGWFRLAYCVGEQTIRASRTAFVRAMKDLQK